MEVQWFRSLEDEAGCRRRADRGHQAGGSELHWSDFVAACRAPTTALSPSPRALERSGIPYRFTARRVVCDAGGGGHLRLHVGGGRTLGRPTMWRIPNAPCYDVPPADIAVLIQQSDQKAWGCGMRSGTPDHRRLRSLHRAPGADSGASWRSSRRQRGASDRSWCSRRPSSRPAISRRSCGVRKPTSSRPLRLWNAFASRVKRYESGARADGQGVLG